MIYSTRDISDIMLGYCHDIINDNIPSNKLMKLTCQRHLNDLKNLKEYVFSLERAAHAINFFDLLRHTNGALAGQTIELMPWQIFIVGSIFGWVSVEKHPISGRRTRRFKIAEVFIGRKNGKSTLASGIALYCLVMDGEMGAEIYSAATTREQAKIVFNDACQMARKSPGLSALTRERINLLACPATNSKFIPLSSDSKSLDGLKVHMAVCDEIHAHPTREVYDVIETATAGRTQPLVFVISTAGTILNGIATELWNYGTQILNGTVKNENFFCALYSIDPDDAIDDERAWYKANPCLGVSKSIKDMSIDCEKAKAMPSARANFFTKHLNVFVQGDAQWLPLEKLERCEVPPQELNTDVPCFVGLDLAQKRDLCAVGLVFPQLDGSHHVITKGFICQSGINRCTPKVRLIYDDLIRAGHLVIAGDESTDYEYIREYLIECRDKYNVRGIGYDPYNASYFCQQLEEVDQLPMIEISQSSSNLNEPSKHIESMVYDATLKYHDTLFKWCALNAVVKEGSNGNIHVIKNRTQAELKIDALIAVIIGLCTSKLIPPEPEYSPPRIF